MSILDWLADDGVTDLDKLSPVTRDELGAHLRTEYLASEAERNRRERARTRQLYYNGAGDEKIEELIRLVFNDPDVTHKRTQWVGRAKFNNVLRRVVNEQSSCYSEPAKRTVTGEENQTKYELALQACNFDQQAIRINRWLNLHRSLAVGFRVRVRPDGKREPVIDVVTPDQFCAIAHPTDRSLCLGLMIALNECGPRVNNEAAYMVWTAKERFRVSRSGHVMTDTWKSNQFGVNTWMLLSLEPPAGKLLDDTTNEELVAAHEAVWFEHVCLLKESKSATKVPAMQGDTRDVTRQQAADSENVIDTGDANLQVLDFSMDLSLFRETARTIYETAAANAGLAAALVNHAGVQSAEARELLRAPLYELRREQQVPLRRFEREFAEVMAAVLRVDLPDMAFTTEGWRIDFGESRTAMSEREEVDLLEKKKRLSLTSILRYKREKNPDLSEDDAVEEMAEDIEAEGLRIRLMKPIMVASGQAQGEPDGAQDAVPPEGEEAAA